MHQLDIFELVLEQMEGHVALRVGSGRTTPNEDFRVPLCLSTILFDCVFQLLLDFLHPKSCLGYTFKSTPTVSTVIKAYADDLTLITRKTLDMQLSVDSTNVWLKWTQTMKAKPS